MLADIIVAHADNLTGKTGPRTLAAQLAKLLQNGTPLPIIARIILLDDELHRLAGGPLANEEEET